MFVSKGDSFNFHLTDDQLQIQELARKFTHEELMRTEKHYDQTGEYPWEHIKQMHELGLLNTIIPQEYGGKADERVKPFFIM